MKKIFLYLFFLCICINLFSSETGIINEKKQYIIPNSKSENTANKQFNFEIAQFGKKSRNGSGMILIGALLIGTLGIPVSIGGTVLLAGYINHPNTIFNINSLSLENSLILAASSFLFIIGGLSLISGIILLIIGCIRYSKYKKNNISFYAKHGNSNNIYLGLRYSF